MRVVGVDVRAGRQPVAAEVAEAFVVVAAPAEERVVPLRDAPVHAQRRGERIERRLVRGEGREVGRAEADRGVLLGLLHVAEEEQPILQGRAAEVASELVPMEVRLRGREAGAGGHSRASVEEEGAAVQLVAPALGDDVDGAGGAQPGGGIRGRDRDLELLDAVLRDVDGGGADVLVDGIHTVDRDPRLAPVAAAYRDPRVAALGRIEGAPLLDLHAGLELGQLQVVAAVEGQLVDLAKADHAADRGLGGVDGNGLGGHLHALAASLHFHHCVHAHGLPHLDGDALRHEVGESLAGDPERVFPRLQRRDHEVALIIGDDAPGGPGGK